MNSVLSLSLIVDDQKERLGLSVVGLVALLVDGQEKRLWVCCEAANAAYDLEGAWTF